MNPELKNLRVRIIKGVISTDDIIPAVYKHSFTDPAELAKYIFSNYLPGFAETVRENDILVCTELAGIGSSREQAVTALKAAGFRAIVAPAFGRIFYRNCWNNAFPALCAENLSLREEDIVTFNLDQGLIETEGQNFRFEKPSPFLLEIAQAGGLMEHYLQEVK